MEKAMEARGAKPEAFDFFILYTAWMTVQDREIRHERMRAGNISPPERPVVAMEHGDGPFGEAIASPNHSAWANGSSMADMAEATIEFDEERNLFGKTFNDNYTA